MGCRHLSRMSKVSTVPHLKLPFTLRYSRPVFQFLESLTSDATKDLGGLRHRESLPEGPDVEIYEAFDKLAEAQDQMDYFMGASRARQLLAIIHKTGS
jgi:hypothetical protein